MIVSFDHDSLVELMARAIAPMWFETYQDPERGECCVLNNYPGQHLNYQEAARLQALDLIRRYKR